MFQKKSECKDGVTRGNTELEAWKVQLLPIVSVTSDLKEAPLLWKLKLQNFCGKLKSKISDTDIWFQIEIAKPSVEDTYDDIKVEKIDCVGHVQKRMGKHLLKLKADTKGKLGDGKTIGGKDSLTETKIEQLQRYYGLAIRQMSRQSQRQQAEVELVGYTMKKKRITATLGHNVQTNTLQTQHRYCPPGANSWCKWQQDKATGTKTYKPDSLLPLVFLEVFRPAFMTLSETKLLGRCVRGVTQNRSE